MDNFNKCQRQYDRMMPDEMEEPECPECGNWMEWDEDGWYCVDETCEGEYV